MSGVVSEFRGGPIAGALVQAPDGTSTTTDAAGAYTLSNLASQFGVTASTPGSEYEAQVLPLYATPRDVVVNVRLPRAIRRAAGETFDETLFVDDAGYGVLATGAQLSRVHKWSVRGRGMSLTAPRGKIDVKVTQRGREEIARPTDDETPAPSGLTCC